MIFVMMVLLCNFNMLYCDCLVNLLTFFLNMLVVMMCMIMIMVVIMVLMVLMVSLSFRQCSLLLLS